MAGLIAADFSASERQRTAQAMAEALAHRGPDDHGVWADEANVALSHRRLSILDLSPNGHQPMHSASGRFVITFNGEIYNFPNLRRELEPSAVFKGHSDTEVLLAALERWGLEGTLPRLNGMFAFALWDRSERRLSLVRDRTGEKPLYYSLLGKRFYFASELSAFMRVCPGAFSVDPGAVAELLQQRCVPAPLTIFREAQKLPPAHFVHVSLANGVPQPGEPKPYWHLPLSLSPTLPEEASIAETERLLRDAVRMRMVADVPVGAFLSGGVDSSLISALMQSQSSQKIRTYTVAFQDDGFDESRYARTIAEHLGTEHTELPLTASELLAAVPKMAEAYSEPFADSSQIPTYLIAALTRQHVTVVLSGDGGDEIFGGYDRYQTAMRMWDRVRALPLPLRATAAYGLRFAGPGFLNAALGWSASPFGINKRGRSIGEKLMRVSDLLACSTFEEFYVSLISQWRDFGRVLNAQPEGHGGISSSLRKLPKDMSILRRMMLTDQQRYLPDEILVKVDRATMAVSLESRIPLLDHRLIELAARLPESLLQRKRVLKLILERYVPRALFDRPKMGFGGPVGTWLRGPLKSWAGDILSNASLEETFNRTVVQSLWREHIRGRVDYSYDLWPILMFQAWRDHWHFGQNRANSFERPARAANIK